MRYSGVRGELRIDCRGVARIFRQPEVHRCAVCNALTCKRSDSDSSLGDDSGLVVNNTE
jgi:hypothetical protein